MEFKICDDAIRKAIDASGASQAGISKELGKTRNYVNASLHQADANDGTIGCDKAAAMLEACDYRLAAIPIADVPASALIIDPPHEDEPSQACD